MKDYSRIGKRTRNSDRKIAVKEENAKTGDCPKCPMNAWVS